MGKSNHKILYFCADAGIPYWGTKGGSIHMREFVTNLKDIGYRISVVAKNGSAAGERSYSVSYYDLPEGAENRSENSRVNNDEENRLITELSRFGKNTENEIYLRNLNAGEKFDLVYERYSLFSVAGLRLARSLRIPFVLEVNAPLIKEALKYRQLVLRDLAGSVEKHLFLGADHIIAVSQAVADYILNLVPDARVTVVPNGVTADRFTGPWKESAADSILSRYKESDFVVCFVGNLRPWHGVDILIDSFAELPDDGRRNRLLVVGGKGKLKSQLKQKCLDRGLKGKFKFTGAVEHDDIPALLHRADVLAAPYPNLDNFYFSALKIFEYMAAGKPIVASAIGQIEKILTHETNCLLVPPGDTAALRDAILRLKNDPELARKLGKNARKEAVDKHTWKHRMEKIDNIFEELISGSPVNIAGKDEAKVRSSEN